MRESGAHDPAPKVGGDQKLRCESLVRGGGVSASMLFSIPLAPGIPLARSSSHACASLRPAITPAKLATGKFRHKVRPYGPEAHVQRGHHKDQALVQLRSRFWSRPWTLRSSESLDNKVATLNGPGTVFEYC